jgi:hypothetical protein
MTASIKKKLLASYRTMYTTLICIVVINAYKFGGTATYVSALLSAISASSAYFGQWQIDCWKVLYAAFFGAAIGVPIGYVWQYNYLSVILLFISLTWLYRISYWDRLAKVICGLGLVLGALYPTLTNGKIIGVPLIQDIIPLLTVPWLITGCTLLFPRLTLASYAAQDKVST